MRLPVAFDGASPFIQNVCDFGNADLVSFDAKIPDLFGVSMDTFLVDSWLDQRGNISAERWLSQVPDRVAELARQKRCIILFDMSGEGPPFMEDHFRAIHAALHNRQISPKTCVLLQQNRRLPADYHSWAQCVGAAPMNNLFYDFYPRRMAGLLARSDKDYQPNINLREKMFLCLNFTPRAHRASLVSWLITHNFSDLGFISFHTQNKLNQNSSEINISEHFPKSEKIDNGIRTLQKNAPLLLDLCNDQIENPDFSMVPDIYYDQSYFSIVTDSDVDHNVNRFTEKLIKPLAMYHPFILIGYPNTLKLIREFGFQTFAEIFDESYDSIENPSLRIESILKELRRIMSHDRKSLQMLYNKMEDTLIHNAGVARRILDQQYHLYKDEVILSEIMSYIEVHP